MIFRFGGDQSVFDPHGPIARSIATHGWWLLLMSIAVYLVVMVALLIALGRRRREIDDQPETTRRLTRNVSIAVALTVVILVGIAASSVVSGRGIYSPSGAGAVTVDVVGHQWWWDFQYHDVTPSDVFTSPNELHIPVGLPVVIKAMSTDVIHSFWVPNLMGKRDLIPGIVTNTWIQADEPGVYRGQCAEFCGHQHAHMALEVVAEPMNTFQAWIRHQREPAAEPATDEERRGKDVFMQSTCVTCHAIRGTDAGSHLGPELTHVASRLTIAAGTLPNARGHLAGWIANSQSIKPGNRMPPNALTPDDLQAVLAYVRSLR
ncbi:MAG: cytochrome c oxidase subunit II [Acidobacteria bacterium]|nr:MAG: cytochrome c oxidase subunit II [Acidobacteriota bacterium]